MSDVVVEIEARHKHRLDALESGVADIPTRNTLSETMQDVETLLEVIDRMSASRLNEYVFDRLQNDLLCVIKPEALPMWWQTEVPALGGRTPRKAWNDGDIVAVARVAWSYLDPSFG